MFTGTAYQGINVNYVNEVEREELMKQVLPRIKIVNRDKEKQDHLHVTH